MNIKKIIRAPHDGMTHRVRNDNFIDPFREWFISLLCAALLLVGGGAYFYFDYRLSWAEMDVVPEVETTIIRYRQVDIAQYLTILEARAKQHEALRAQVFYRPLPAPEVSTSSESVSEGE